jgi:hypothetical protein
MSSSLPTPRKEVSFFRGDTLIDVKVDPEGPDPQPGIHYICGDNDEEVLVKKVSVKLGNAFRPALIRCQVI